MELMVLILKMESNVQVMLALLVSNKCGVVQRRGRYSRRWRDVYISYESKTVFRVGISEERETLKMTRM
jgi:hypothetical protein